MRIGIRLGRNKPPDSYTQSLDPLTPAVIQPIVGQVPHRGKLLLKLVGLLVAATLFGAALWAAYKYVYIPVVEQPYRFSYSTLDSVSIPGPKAGSGLSFSKPQEIATIISQDNSQVELEHLTTRKGSKHFVSYISAGVSAADNELSKEELLMYDWWLTHPDNKLNPEAYTSITKPLNSFIKDRLPQNWQINLGKAQPFKNSSIKANAWSFDLSAVSPDQSKTITSRAIYAISGPNHHYFLLTTIDYNWLKNQSVWQQVTDSLRIGL